MKIISRSKDYYDYLQGIYGMDEKIIYKRPVTALYYPTRSQLIAVFLCGLKIYGYYDEPSKKFYYGEAMKRFGKPYCKRGEEVGNYIILPELRERFGDIINTSVSILPQPDLQKINEKYGEPVCYKPVNFNDITSEPQFPNLQSIDFNKYMDAKTIWLKISDWLSPKDIPMPARPDKEKIISHGFDLKTSFRKTK